jgi:predicted secreted Zn-dependent protease
MKRHLAMIALCALLLPLAATGQRCAAQVRPAWVDGYFYETGNSYIESMSATGPTEDEARNKAAAIAMERRLNF